MNYERPHTLTIGELIDALSKFDRATLVYAYWEMHLEELDVVLGHDGIVVLDADGSLSEDLLQDIGPSNPNEWFQMRRREAEAYEDKK